MKQLNFDDGDTAIEIDIDDDDGDGREKIHLLIIISYYRGNTI
jgi:hypothetical protein